MSDKEWISPTDEENEILRKKIIEVIFPIIKPMVSDKEYPVSVKRILSAIEAAKKMEKAADIEFEAKNPDKHTHSHYVHIMDLVATCIAALVQEEDDITLFPPHSMAGQHIMCFANAIRIMQAACSLESALYCDSDDYGWDTAKMVMDNNSKE